MGILGLALFYRLAQGSNPALSEPPTRYQPCMLPHGHPGAWDNSYSNFVTFYKPRAWIKLSRKEMSGGGFDPATFGTEVERFASELLRHLCSLTFSRLVMLQSLLLLIQKDCHGWDSNPRPLEPRSSMESWSRRGSVR